MSLYEDLSNIAAQKSLSFFEEKDSCTIFARRVLYAYITHLEAPSSAVNFVTLDYNMSGTGEKLSPNSTPKLTQGADYHWYFGIGIKFQSTSGSGIEETIVIGLMKQEAGFSARLENNTSINVTNEDTFNTLIAMIYALTEENIKNIGRRSTSRIGFTRE